MKTIFLFFILMANICFGQVDLNLGLRAYYPFSGNDNDVSGNNNNPVFNNATLTEDRFGNAENAYHFNGRNNYMRIPNSISLNTGKTLSVCVWVRPTGFYSGLCHTNSVLVKGEDDDASKRYFIWYDDYAGSNAQNCGEPLKNKLQNFRAVRAYTPPPGYKPYIKKNQWYSVVVTYDGDTARMYIDGRLIRVESQAGQFFSNLSDLFLGRFNALFAYSWVNGDIDEVRIYDRALNQQEIMIVSDKDPGLTVPAYVEERPQKKKDTVALKKADPESVKPGPLPAVNKQAELTVSNINLLSLGKEKGIVLEERKNDLLKEITVDNDSILVTLYDNAVVDGDSITLIYNDTILATHQLLTENPITYKIKIAPGDQQNILKMYAENMGTIPPNTALMVIYDGNKRYEVNIKSTEKTNGSVSFKLREEKVY